MMKAGKLFVVLLIAFLGTSCVAMNASTQVQAYGSISQNQFYDDLAPYGNWIQVSRYGLVWQPWDIPYGWRPYSDGYWVYTDYGWTFESDAPYGWAVYHYGRWAFDSRFGWVWVPGDEWGPAWVAWRYGDGYIGWAPLAPEVSWSVQGGFGNGGVNIEVGIGSFGWCFVGQQHFYDRHIRNYLEVPARNVTILRNSRNVTRYNLENHRIVNNSISVGDIERYSRQKVDRYNTREVRSRNEAGFSSRGDNELRIYRPRVEERPSRNEVSPSQNIGRNQPSRFGRETPQQVQQRHGEEAKRFNSQAEEQRRQLDNIHQQQRDQAKANEERKPIIRQQKTEERTFNQNRNRETKVLEQRQRREEREVNRQPREDKSQRERKER